MIKKTSGKDSCELAGLSDSWSNPIDKTACGIIRFMEDRIVAPLIESSCYMYAGAMNLNYDTDITATFENNNCIIQDK